jgi:dCTP deaminase
MMTDGEITRALAHGELEIDPLENLKMQIQPCSVDLRISDEFSVYRRDYIGRVKLGQNLNSAMWLPDDLWFRPEQGIFTLDPGGFALGVTIERVKLPAHILGRVEGRSSIGRMGLFVHITAGFIDPGFEGRITLELYNASPVAIEIPFGHRICQLALTRLAEPCVRPYGTARGSKYVGDAATGLQTAKEEK